MARLARVVVPGYPHHITQRGNRRLPTFFGEEDYEAYLALMAEHCAACGVEIWAYCLMPNHIHLIAVPKTKRALARAIGEAHRRYTRRINVREGWRGYLWQGRFASFVMDEPHLLAAARYVERNPVRARLVRRPWRWRWSSAAAHVAGKDDGLVRVQPLLDLVTDWRRFVVTEADEAEVQAIRLHGRTGRPLGDLAFVLRLEKRLRRRLLPGQPGRPRKGRRK
ncbi:MAG TPA: transposase [Phycisphaerae bacterium]|nr:transposase [Phycisphaerae bacterium]